jgi:hypothetical protein
MILQNALKHSVHAKCKRHNQLRLSSRGKTQIFGGTPNDPSVNIKLYTADDRRRNNFQSIMTAFRDCQKHFKHLHAT